MSCNSGATTKNCVKTENCDLNAKISVGKINYSCLEQETANKASSFNLDMFRKYLPMRNEQESQAFLKESQPRPSKLLISGVNFRFPSLLERQLFPGINEDTILPTLSNEKSRSAQLTIFYAGTIHVYDNVPVDKAQTIMLLAGESSLSAPPMAKKMPDNLVKKPVVQSTLPSICKLQADLPLARKYSLQRFMEKRRGRINKKCPYAPPPTTSKQDESTGDDDDGPNEKQSLTLSPFPSRLGFLLAKKGS